MKCLKYIPFLIAVIMALFGCNGSGYSGKKQPRAVNGVLDLRGWNFEKDGPVKLKGDWDFYWDQLLEPAAFAAEIKPSKTGLLAMPGAWNGYPVNNKKLSGDGYATFRLRIYLDSTPAPLALHGPIIFTASRFFVNGTLRNTTGRVSKDKDRMIPRWLPGNIHLHRSNESLELLLQISNFHHRLGGATEPFVLGNTSQISQTRDESIALTLFVMGSLVIMGLYHLGIFFTRRKDKTSLYFGLLCLVISLRSLYMGEIFLEIIFPGFNWAPALKVDYMTLYMTTPLTISFLDGLFKGLVSKPAIKIVWLAALVFVLGTALLPVKVASHTLKVYHVILLSSIAYMLYILLVALIKRREGAGIFLLGALVMVVSVVNDILFANQIIHSRDMSNFGVFAFIFAQAYLLSSRSSRAFTAVEELTGEMEVKVKARTRELAQANEKLQRVDRAKTRFFANISHEFRTPLTLILAPVESLLKGDYGKNNSKTTTVLTSVMQNGARLLRLINNLLDFTKLEAGRMSANKQKTDMVELLEYYKSSVESGAESMGLELVFKDNTQGVTAYIDRDLMEKAIMNLLSNAIKFTPAGGRISIQLDQTLEDQFQLSVQDTGIGVPEDKLESIFERFSQVDESSSRKHEGTGIGLSLTKEIIELHKGIIWVDSSPGKGTVISITLPLGEPGEELEESKDVETTESLVDVKSYLMAEFRENSSDNAETPPVENEGPKEHRILLVEDNADMRSFIQNLLGRDYDVKIAVDGNEGLVLARVFMPDLVLSDVMMPEMDGYEMTQELKRGDRTRDIPVILLSAKADVVNRVEGLEFGADDYLSKPFNAEELLARIRNQIEGKKLERELKKEKEERDKDFKQAALIQKSILTSRDIFLQLEALEIELVYLPMNGQVSGDYYNISRLNQDITSIFLADATGHGTQAALSTMQIDMLYRENLEKKFPGECFESINKKFVSELHSKNYFTGIIVDILSDRIRYSSAGHPEQYLIKSTGGEIRKLRTRGWMIGMREEQHYEMEEVQVQKGDMLLLFSDGIYEVFNADGEEFGEARFFELIQEGIGNGFGDLPMGQVIQSILGRLDEYRGGVPFRDDITLIGVRMK